MVASENAETIGFDAIAYVELVPFDAPDISCGAGRSAAHAVQVALDEAHPFPKALRRRRGGHAGK